jgi:hypothetical protein
MSSCDSGVSKEPDNQWLEEIVGTYKAVSINRSDLPYQVFDGNHEVHDRVILSLIEEHLRITHTSVQRYILFRRRYYDNGIYQSEELNQDDPWEYNWTPNPVATSPYEHEAEGVGISEGFIFRFHSIVDNQLVGEDPGYLDRITYLKCSDCTFPPW